MADGFSKVLEVLANKVSRKAAIVAIAMVLIYLIVSTGTTQYVVFSILCVSGLAVFFTILQWILDFSQDRSAGGNKGKGKNKDKIGAIIEEIEEEAEENDTLYTGEVEEPEVSKSEE